MRLVECVRLSEGGASRVDREAGTIGPVKVLGWTSANGREYVREGVSASLYEGRRVCVGHVRAGERSPTDTVGLLEGARVEPDGVYADRLRLLDPEGPFERRVLSAAESAPHLFGLSHVARGRERPGSGGRVIESVESVESVDLVTDPATVRGFYESRGATMKVRELIESLKAKRPGYSRALKEMAEAGILPADAGMAEPPAEGEGEPKDHEQALRDAAKAVLDDASLSAEEQIKKIKAILKMLEGTSGGGTSGGGTSGGGTSGGGDGGGSSGGETEESRRRREEANLREELARLKARDLLRTEADAAGVRLSGKLVEAVAKPGLTQPEAKALIDELRPAGGGSQRPKSAPPPAGTGQGGSGRVQESKVPEGDGRAVGRWLRG